jgi:hypothetical protein
VTIDSPKGPEREARPAESGSAPSGYTCVFTHAPGVVLCDFCKPIEPELERLAAEVGQLRFDLTDADRSFEFVRKQRDRFGERMVERAKELTEIRAALVTLGEESIPSHVTTLQAVQWLISEHHEQVKHNGEVGEENRALCDERDRLQAEVSRLREQLATLTARHEATLRTESFKIGDIVCWRGDRWFEGRIVCETAEEDKILDTEVWDLEVTDPGTMFADVDMTGRPVHVSPDCLVLVERPAPVSESVPATPQRIFVGAHSLKTACHYCYADAVSMDTATDRYHFAAADPLRASAPSEASPKGFGRCVVCGKSGDEHKTRQWCMSDQYVDGTWPSSPPSGGDSDTTPRVWAVGDPEPDESVQTVRAANSQVFRRIWLRSARHPLWQAGIGGQVTWAVLLGAVGPVTEVLPSPSSLPQEGGTDD